MKSLVQFIRRVATSRLGQFLFVLHLVLAIYALTAKSTADFGRWWNDCMTIPLAGRAVRLPLETPLLKTVGYLDLPALILYYPVAVMLYLLLPHVSSYTMSWIGAGILLLLASLQWWLIGCGIERFIGVWRR